MAQPVFSLSQHTRHEVFEAIVSSLNSMPENLRKVFVLSHYQGLGPAEIGERLNLAESDIAKLLEEANLNFFEGVRRLRM